MALIKCKECGHIMSDKATCCPNCGSPNEQDTEELIFDDSDEPERSSRKKLIAIIAAVVVLIAAGVALWYAKSKPSDPSAIKAEEQKDEYATLTPSMIAILNSYEVVGGCFEGKMLVCRDNKYGYIDKEGNEIISCQYDNAENFSEGMAAVCKNEKWGFIDENGKLIINFKYHETGDFVDDLAPVSNNDGKWGYIDKSGNLIVPCKYEWAQNFSEGRAAVTTNNLYGYINKEGIEFVKCEYSNAYPFSEGRAGVVKDDKVGFINKKGKLVIPCQYDYNEDFLGFKDFARPGKYSEKYEILELSQKLDNIYSEGLVAVSKDGKYGAIDKKGQVVIPFAYDKIGCFIDGLAPVLVNDKWGYIDKNDNIVIPCQYNYAESFSCGYALVGGNGGIRYIDKSGKTLIKLPGSDLELFPYSFHEGFATTQIKDSFIESIQVTYVDNFQFPKDKYIVCDTHGNCSFSGEYETNYLKEIKDLQNQIDEAVANYYKEQETHGPEWTAGTWRVRGTLHDRYAGNIVIDLLLVIDRDNNQMLLKNLHEGEVMYVGNYEYEDNKIKYDSRNGMTTTISLTSDERLDFGSGMIFKKVSSNTDVTRYL